MLTLSQLTMDQWIMGHGSNGSTNLGGSRGFRDPLTHFTLYSSGIPRDFLVHAKPATAIETYFDRLFDLFTITVTASVVRDEQTTSEMHISLGRSKFCWNFREL